MGFYQPLSTEQRIYLNREIDNDILTAYTGNNSFIVLVSDIFICIYVIDDPNSLKKIVLKEKGVSSAKMHPFYKTIFLTLCENEIKIWEIFKSLKECKLKVKIKGHTKYIKGADFCRDKKEDKLLASYSDDNTIKIWNLDKAFCLNNISAKEPAIKIELFSKYLYYCEERTNIILYDNEKLKEINKTHFENMIKDFVVVNEKKIIILYENSILLYNFKNNTKQLKLSLNSSCRQIIYDNELKIIYIFSKDYIYVVNNDYKLFFYCKIKNSNVIFLDKRINNQYICANFLINSSEIYNFESKDLYNKTKIVSLEEPQNNFWDKCIPNISDIINISWGQNIFEDTERLNKKYLNIDEIKNELENNYKINLEQKKKDVENQLKNYSKKDDVNEEYLELLKLVIKDNTNKRLINIYLEFIKLNEEQLQEYYNNNYETYNDEFEYYSILFLHDNGIDNHFNKLFQKELFHNLLKQIVDKEQKTTDIFNEEDIDRILKNFIVFNQPITYNNEELYWHRNIFIIYFSLKNLIKKENGLELMKSTIEEISNRGLLNKDYILKDKTLLTSIIALIAIPQEFYICQYNLNLIETMDTQYNYKDKLNNNCLNEDTYEYKGVKLENISEKCIKNFELNIDEKKKRRYFPFKEEELYNYKSYLNYFKDFINIDKINEFLSKIFCSNTFKQAFGILYPENFSYPFKSKEEALEFIKNHFNYIPFKISTTNAITDKFSLESYFFLKLKNIFLNVKVENNDKLANFVKTILYHSSIIKTNTHEINHEFYNMLFLHSNGYYPVETPRKIRIDERESGKNLEMLLFNRKERRITLEESMYILNEKNYEKSLEDFRTGFNELKEEDIKIGGDGIFSNFNEIFEEAKNNGEILRNCLITADDMDDDEGILSSCFIDNTEDENDVLGFLRKI